MKQKITPFLWFDKNAEEAMNFYCGIFKSASIKSIKRYPSGITEGPMKNMDGKVLTAVFELEGQTFMCLDGGPFFKPTGAVSFLVTCKDQAEIDYYWDKLTESGDPKNQQCGWLMDKFGFSWQVVPGMDKWLNSPDNEANMRATQAMLKMKKIIIADLEKAYENK